jgi:hypothetical protein
MPPTIWAEFFPSPHLYFLFFFPLTGGFKTTNREVSPYGDWILKKNVPWESTAA